MLYISTTNNIHNAQHQSTYISFNKVRMDSRTQRLTRDAEKIWRRHTLLMFNVMTPKHAQFKFNFLHWQYQYVWCLRPDILNFCTSSTQQLWNYLKIKLTSQRLKSVRIRMAQKFELRNLESQKVVCNWNHQLLTDCNQKLMTKLVV